MAKPTNKRKAPAKPPRRPAAKQSAGLLDKGIDIIKWVDNPFKLIVVIMLGSFGLAGWMIYENRDKIMGRIIAQSDMPTMVSDERLTEIGHKTIRDLSAETFVVYSVDLAKNMRTTRVALAQNGRNNSVEQRSAAFFSGSPYRNKAAISVLTGEMFCEEFQPSSDIGDWLVERGVVYACRASIPPEVGSMVGYMTIGFKKAPRDIIATKTRINQAAAEMAR